MAVLSNESQYAKKSKLSKALRGIKPSEALFSISFDRAG